MRDIIVVGGSAGSLDAICTLLKELPAKLPASVFIVVHVADQNCTLGQVLGRCGPLQAATAKHGETIRHGRAYVAPGGRHLVLNNGQIQLTKGPRENRHLPSVDTLFRSAARAHRDRVIGVVLSGALDDGAAGAYAIKTRGGVVIVQDPKDAKVPDMPLNTLRYGNADHCLPLSEIAPTIIKLVREKRKATTPPKIKNGNGARKGRREDDQAAPVVCPDCGGPLTEVHEGKLLQFKCRVGHVFSPEALSQGHSEALERAVWVALRHLSERRAIQQTLAGQYKDDLQVCKRFEENAEAAAHDMALLREVLERL
jgi:two-component system chemotaxis response regulator CheB